MFDHFVELALKGLSNFWFKENVDELHDLMRIVQFV